MKPSDVGAMRERVTIQTQAQTADAAGAISTVWTNGATIWARMEPVSATRVVLAGRDDSAREYDMTIRFRADMLTQTRIVWRGRFFAVLGVMDKTEQRVFLTVRLREINA